MPSSDPRGSLHMGKHTYIHTYIHTNIQHIYTHITHIHTTHILHTYDKYIISVGYSVFSYPWSVDYSCPQEPSEEVELSISSSLSVPFWGLGPSY